MALPGTVDLYITDKDGGKHWRTNVGVAYSSGERNNLKRHLAAIKARHPAYAKCEIDAETARLAEEYPPGEEAVDLSPEAIMRWLTE